MAKVKTRNRRKSQPIKAKARSTIVIARPRNSIRAKFDAAITSDDNRRHWANADGLSADAANSAEVRRTLRNRSRYEISNNSYARGISLTLANDTIGTGPRLQMLTPNENANRTIEVEFSKWARAVDLAGKLRTMRLAKFGDGEAFCVLRTNEGLPTNVTLDLQLIEADQVASPEFSATVTNDVDGIEYDNFGNPRNYLVLRNHPGDSGVSFAQEFDRIPADQVIHWYRKDRPGQSRGIPELTPALPLFAQLRRYTLAVLAAAETAADFAVLLKSTLPPESETPELNAFESLEIEQRMMTALPVGYEGYQLKAEQPAQSYEMFKSQVLNEIARCLNMPFNIAAGNSSGYNYSSGRLDHQTYFKSIRVDQAQAETIACDRILTAWFDEVTLLGSLPTNLGPFMDWPHQWFWDGFEHVDPVKESKADEIDLKNNTTTLAIVWGKKGIYWKDALKQRALEREFMSELGMDDAAPDDPEEIEEEEVDEEEELEEVD